MIDELIFNNDKITRCRFRITDENIFTINGQFVEAGLLENMAQPAAARAGYIACLEKKSITIGYIGAVKNFEIFCMPKIKDELITEIQIEEDLFNIAMVTGRIWREDKLISQCEMKIFMT